MIVKQEMQMKGHKSQLSPVLKTVSTLLLQQRVVTECSQLECPTPRPPDVSS
jgi:hypothetical protein